MAESSTTPTGWTPYVRDEDPRPDVEWSGYIHDEASSGPAIAYNDVTGEPLFLVWWSDFGNGCSRITGWRPLSADFDAPEWDCSAKAPSRHELQSPQADAVSSPAAEGERA